MKTSTSSFFAIMPLIFTILFSSIFADYYSQIKDLKKDLENKTCKECSISFIQVNEDLQLRPNDLQQILLIRHGEPALKKKGWLKRKEAIAFSQAYDSVGVYPLEFMPFTLNEGEIVKLYTSTLPRAKSTAHLIFGNTIQANDSAIFREFERKIFGFPNVKLPLKFWTIGSRLLWLTGLNDRHIESKRQAFKRAEEAAGLLRIEASTGQNVVLVAHGFLNRKLISILKKEGWEVVIKGGSDYLSSTLLVRMKN